MEVHGLKITGIKQAQTTNAIVEGIQRRGKKINQLNEGPEIKLHRGSRTQGRGNN